jgi:hypothetical protein
MALRRAARASSRRMPRDSQQSAVTRLQNEMRYSANAGTFASIQYGALVAFSSVVSLSIGPHPNSGLTLEPTCVLLASNHMSSPDPTAATHAPPKYIHRRVLNVVNGSTMASTTSTERIQA